MGDLADDRANVAEQQLLLGAHLQRSDPAPTNWAIPEAQWTWTTLNEPGAEDLWLDRWGFTFNVPRIQGEHNPAYATRILAEVTRPGTVNMGMAQCIDEALGIVGTLVVETLDYFPFEHFNEGHHCNSGIRANMTADLGGVSPWATFVILIPNPIKARSSEIAASVAMRKHAGGTRLFRVYGYNYVVPGLYVEPGYVEPGYVE